MILLGSILQCFDAWWFGDAAFKNNRIFWRGQKKCLQINDFQMSFQDESVFNPKVKETKKVGYKITGQGNSTGSKVINDWTEITKKFYYGEIIYKILPLSMFLQIPL